MIKTVILEDGVNVVDLSDGQPMTYISYPFAHIIVKSGSVLVSQSPDVAEGADGTAKTDSYVRIDLTGNKLYMIGSGVVEIHTSISATPPFKRASGGGDNSNSGTLFSIGLYGFLPPIEDVLISETETEE